MNYESFFGFQQRPFAATPNIQSYFAAESIESARRTLARIVERGSGAGLVIGPPGSGKSLLLQVLASQLHGRFELASLTDGHAPASRRELLQSILFELELPYRGFDEGELRLSLIDHLARGLAGVPLLILVDDAQHLAVDLLEEIRLLADVARSGAPRVRVVLAGTASLEEKFAHPTLEAFSQRLAARAYLSTLSREETQGYITAQLGSVGGNVFSILAGDAIDQIYRATDGVPRLINQVCDHALMLAANRGQRKFDGSLIQEAWSELQQLPAPWNASHASESTLHAIEEDAVIEFGGLDEVSAPVSPAPQATPVLAIVKPAPVVAPDAKSAPTAKPAVFEPEPLTASFELELRDEPARPSVLKLPAAKPVQAAPVMEEEVIIDRYASLDACSVRRPAVYSVEGLELAALMGLQIPEEKPAPALQVVSAEPVAPVQPVEPIFETVIAEISLEPLALEAADEYEGDDEFSDNDDDLIVVEDDVVEHQFGNLSIVSAKPVRREEYKSMFSRMRRGQTT